MLVSVFGPLSSFAVSKRSQTYQLEKALTNAGMLQDGVIVADPDASDDTKHQVTSIINYFDSMHSLSDIKYLEADFTKDDMSDVFGFESYYSYNRFTDSYRIASEYGAFDIIDVQGYDYIADFSKYRERITFQSDDGGIEILASGENSEIMTLSLEGEVLFEIDLLETYMPYFKEDGGSVQHDYSKNYDNDNIRIRIVMISANYVKSDDYTDFNYDLKLMFEIK
jgi:hypothetical protein